MNIKNPNTVRPTELKAGDILVCTVVCYIDEMMDDQLMAKIYKAKYLNPDYLNEPGIDIPQGQKVAEITSEKSDGFDLLRFLFPVVTWAMDLLNSD